MMERRVDVVLGRPVHDGAGRDLETILPRILFGLCSGILKPDLNLFFGF